MFRVVLFAEMRSEQRDSCYSKILKLNSNIEQSQLWSGL